ncbi:MAG: ATP-binding protein, partial [Acidobacteriota bacterium]
EAPPLQMDLQQMLFALNTLLARSVEASPEGATLRLKLQSNNDRLTFSIFDEGERLTEAQRESLFALLTNERMNKTSLNLALARRIIEAHGGQVAALATEPLGLEVRITIGI